MKLSKVRITNFKSILDTTWFDVNDISCLVGKNEAGKTAVLEALYRLNPIIENHGDFDVTDDYPRRLVSDYEDDVEVGRREPAIVIQAQFLLEDEDINEVKSVFGPNCLVDKNPSVILNKGYKNQRTFNGLKVNHKKTLEFLIENAGLSTQLASKLKKKNSIEEILTELKGAEQTEATKNLTPLLQKINEHDLSYVVYNDTLINRVPKFLYFDEYYQLKGQDNIEALKKRISEKTLHDSDHPLLGLLELARLDLDQITDPRRTEALIAKLEAAESQLTSKVLKYWSQNKHLRMKFDFRPAQPEDPPGMTTGTNIWGRVNDTKHMVTTGLGTRSRGFVWFFSFLAWYSQLKRKNQNIILLLDEPGLSLHAKAQEDLLNYFEKELKPYHQVLYTTHSPFMVDSTRFHRVKIVQDLSIEADDDELPEDKQGTKVISEVLDATPDSLFPLQGALGYEIYQTMFIGPNSLVVEGVSDLLYLQTISALLQSKGEEGLKSEWVITPVGGSDKVPTFVALIGSQNHLNVAVLVDYQKKDKQTIENLYKRKLMAKNQVLTFSDFTNKDESDIEDMFEDSFYLKLVNGEFGTSIKVSDLPKGSPRIVNRVEKYFDKNPLGKGVSFNHYRPARYFSENITRLSKSLSETQIDRFRKAFVVLNKLLKVN
jgi:predicted ATP-dependent endonuclease of OLD family